MERKSMVLKIDDDLLSLVKGYCDKKELTVNRLVNELFLGIMSKESLIGAELREKIEERVARPSGRPAQYRADVLRKQEEIRQARAREKKEASDEIHRRKMEIADRAHQRKMEIEKIRGEEQAKLQKIRGEERRKLEEMKREERLKREEAKVEKAQRGEMKRQGIAPEAQRQDPPCEACAMPKSECACVE